jgi:hypothetical protein
MLTALVIVVVLLAWVVALHVWVAHRDDGERVQHGHPSLEDHRRALARSIAMRESFR